MTPSKGFRFFHSRVLNAADLPQMYEVTRVAKGTVYYRPVYAHGLGKPDCCPVEDFPKWRLGGRLRDPEAIR